MTDFRSIVSTRLAPFIELVTPVSDWWKLPLSLRNRWMDETDFGAQPPNDKLIDDVQYVLDGHPYDDPNERPPPGQENNPRKIRDAHIAATKAKHAPRSSG